MRCCSAFPKRQWQRDFQRLLRYSDVDQFELKSWELRVALRLQTVSDIDQRSFVECYFSAAGWPVEAAAPAECAETERFSGFFELEADVFLFDEADRRCEP